MKDIIEIDGKKYFILFTYVDDDYKYIFYTDNTYNEYKMLNVIFGTYEIINDNYIVKEITEELRKKKDLHFIILMPLWSLIFEVFLKQIK